ncbi:MAG: hypothetical protein LBD64_08020 [Odoribacteraceae bacterium]|jgi:hypothetical protein|nr:hypothetical protein [Odoribacteraceae bacterium]
MKTIILFVVCCLTWASLPAIAGGESKKVPRVSVGLRGGWSYRVGNILEEEEEILENLLSGYNVNADAYYHLNRFLAVGIDYTFSRATNPDANPVLGVYSTGIHNACPSVVFTLHSRDRNNAFVATLCPVGYAGYVEKSVTDGVNVLIKGGNVETSTSVGYDLGLSRHVMLSARVAFHSANLKKMTAKSKYGKTTIDLGDDRLDFSMLQLSIGLRFR